MAPEATTEPHASSLPASIDSLRAVPDLGQYGPDEKTVDALERFQRACNYLAAAMIFLKRAPTNPKTNLQKSDVKSRCVRDDRPR